MDTKHSGETTLLERFEGREAISEPFHFMVRFLAQKPVDMDDLLGTPAVITTQRNFTDTKLYFHGHFWGIRQRAGSDDGLFVYEAELVPWLRFLDLEAHCRIFHKSTVQDIVSTVFGDRGLANYRFDLQAALPKREYTVQYRETDLNFVSRLLEEEGVYYYFQHSKDKHELVLTDKKSGLPVCPANASAQYHPVVGGLGIANPVFEIEALRRVHAGRVELSDYNYETPKVSLAVSLEGAAKKGELCDYPGRYATKSDGDRYARIRLEEEEARASIISGSGSCAGFRVGHTFQLGGHSQRDFNKQYLLVSIDHAGRNASYSAGRDGESTAYHNAFRAIPACVQYRPVRATRRSIVHGTQTAVVTGPDGQEIYTDQYGRVQVRFFWSGGKDTSCWVRVAQTWAGKNWGAIGIPRVGHEVVVDFLEGDPDRPLVIGSVYNADQMPPYELPGNKTRSGVRSHSSEGGSVSNCNEICFEDHTGQEMLFVQAERDNQITVKHDRTKSVGNNESVDVGNDETIKVGHNRTTNISNNDSLTVGSDRTENIGKNASLTVGSDRSASIAKNDSLKVGSQLSVVAGEQIQFTAPGGSITIGSSGITIQSAMNITIQGAMVMIN